jgi:peptidyl-prolyl cis-trans isomerase D
MLKFIRKYSRSWFIWLFLGAIIAVFVLWGVGGFESRRFQEVATVNGQPILVTAYQRQYLELVKQYQEQNRGELTEEMVKAMRLKEAALNRLIDEALIIQAGERLGLKVTDAELRQQIQSYPFFQRDGKFDEKTYFMVLSRNRLNSADFEEQERQRLLLKKIIEELGSLAKVSDAEMQEMFRLGREAVKVSYLAVTPDKFMAKQHPGEADISTYYQEHQAEFNVPSKARVSYLIFRTQDFQDKINISPAEVAGIIKEHPSEYSRPKVIRVRQILLALPPQADPAVRQRLSQQAQEILGKLRAGEDFAQLAKSLSQDPASKDKGGELGYVQRGQHSPEWDRVAFALKPGEVGRADTPQGIYVLKVEEVKETEKIPDAEAKVTQRLKQERARTLAQEAAREARTALSQGTAAEVAKKYGASLQETPLIGLQDQVPNLGPAPAFNQAALQLKVGETSRVVDLPNGFAVMKSLEYLAEHVPPLEQIKDKVAQQVKKQGSLKEADQEATLLLDRLKKGETLAQVAAGSGWPVKESNFFTRFESLEGQRQAEALTSAAFLLSKEHPYPDKPLLWQDKYYILAFKERRAPDQAEFQKDRDKMLSQLLEQKKQELIYAWLDAERRQAKIKVYELP